LYTGEAFKTEYECLPLSSEEGFGGWHPSHTVIVEAKDAVLEGQVSEVYSMSLAGVGRLYARELVNRLLKT
jgi:hypothetical protein